jgi:uncharacterized Zn-finger protein
VNQRGTKNGKKPFECDLCEKRYNRPDHLAVHKRTHTGDKPYECGVCKKKFAQSGNLAVHKRTHTGNKPYECDVCKKRFMQLSSLTWHKKEHLFCNSCRKEIIEPQDFQGHFVEYIGKYACNKCNKRFSNFMTLVQHIARHHGNDGNYQCGLCQELESKEPTGVGYVCCVCDVVFDVPRDLEDHMATHDSI